MNMSYIEIHQLIKVMKKFGFKVFENNSKNFNLNIVIVRNSNPEGIKFNDTLIVFWINRNDRLEFHRFDVTADPGNYYLLNPMNKKGTAIVAPGQYDDVWKLGLHKGKYEALVQNKPITVVRDSNEDAILDVPNYMYMIGVDPSSKNKVFTYGDYLFETGMFGINCHRASSVGIRETIGRYSAGCCVHKNPVEYKVFIEMIKKGISQWGNSFTVTWITEDDYFKGLHAIYNDKELV